MNKKLNIEELVERYLEGGMSDLERLNFENQLINNPAIQEEFQFQKDVVEGIKEYRKAELKARLDNIQVPSSGIYHLIGLKVAALVTITTMVGFGAYYTFFNDQSDKAEIQSPVAINQNHSADSEVEVPEMPTPIEEESLTTEEIVVEKMDKSDKKKSDKEKKSTSKNKEEKATVQEEKQTVKVMPSPNIVKPESLEGLAEDNIDHKDDSFEVSNNSFATINKGAEEKIDVETISDGKKDFHYQFFNKKLFLYGDFDKMPYEILEYNTNKNTLYYLYYQGAFYELNSDQIKITPLKEIEDENLIKELEMLRK